MLTVAHPASWGWETVSVPGLFGFRVTVVVPLVPRWTRLLMPGPARSSVVPAGAAVSSAAAVMVMVCGSPLASRLPLTMIVWQPVGGFAGGEGTRRGCGLWFGRDERGEQMCRG